MQRPRTPSKLSESLHRQLNSYALAASAARQDIRSLNCVTAISAAGVGLLAFAVPTEAKVVYTHAHQIISPDNPANLILNASGATDFRIYASPYHTTNGQGSGMWVVDLARGNGVEGKPGGHSYAYALRAGNRIGNGESFYGFWMAFRWCFSSKKSCSFFGPWANDGKGVKNRYLGLRFVTQGKMHYGWARLNDPAGLAGGTLTGYAYETIPNKSIIAGKTRGKDVITLEPASLGHLARGASAVSAWRRTNSVAASH